MKLIARPFLLLLVSLLAVPVYAGGAHEPGQSGGSPGSQRNGGGTSGSTAPIIKVFVSIPPQEYFVRAIGGDRVAVQSLVPAGVEPENYDPTPRQIVMLSEARLYFAIGLPFETALLPKIRSSMKGITIVDTQAGIKLRAFAQPVGGGSPGGSGGTDPHIWLAPELVKVQGAAIEKALAAADPPGAAAYAAGLKRLDAAMNALHSKIAADFQGLSRRSFFVFHPAFGYFADEFGLKQVSIEAEGKPPGPKQLTEIIAEAKRLKAKTIFVEPQFDQSRAKVLAESVGAKVETLDPLASDYVTNLTLIAKRIRTALQ